MHITIVAGTRPNFVKIAPIIRAIHSCQKQEPSLKYTLVHTGQHYDDKMSGSFFEDLEIPHPNINLQVGSGSHACQTAEVMVAFEKYLINNPTDFVLVVGDVNSTLACSLVAKKMHIKVVHVEGGLRSGDMKMPEEVNRRVTDAISDYFFTTTEDAGKNLVNEGVDPSNIFFVGNTMIDSLIYAKDKLSEAPILSERKISKKEYYLLTLHRPSNVDSKERLLDLLTFMDSCVGNKPIIFPMHPRTRSKIKDERGFKNYIFVEPVRYLEFISLIRDSFAVITDSGGIQEETTFLGVPCMTLRNNTERPETITVGSNRLIGNDRDLLSQAFRDLEEGDWGEGKIPDLWDGNTSHRIIEQLMIVGEKG